MNLKVELRIQNLMFASDSLLFGMSIGFLFHTDECSFIRIIIIIIINDIII